MEINQELEMVRCALNKQILVEDITSLLNANEDKPFLKNSYAIALSINLIKLKYELNTYENELK